MSRSYTDGNLSNDEEDKNDNGKKKKLCVYHALLYISLPFYDYAQRETA